MGAKHSQFRQDYNSRLHRAISRGDAKTTQYLVEKAKSEELDLIEDGHAPINVALYRRNDEIVNLLIEADCNLNLGKDCDFHPLTQAVYMCNITYMRLLLNNGANINAHDKNGNTALHIAVTIKVKGMTIIEMIALLISRGININAQNDMHQTALHICCLYNRFLEAKQIVSTSGCILNLQAANKNTALMDATQGGHEHIVKLLIERHCDIETPNNQGLTPLLLAVTLKHHAIIHMLLEYGANRNTPADKNGMTPLHYAVQISDAHAVRCILSKRLEPSESDADINLMDRLKRTPLTLASALGHPDILSIVELLLANGADITTSNMEGHTPLHQAANYGRIETVKLLLAAGANVTAEDRTGKTALLKAAAEGHTCIVMELLQCGSNVNHRDSQGRTALYLTAQQGRAETMSVLLKAGAMMDLADKEGNAPLHRTVRFPSLHPQSLWKLVQNGCDPINLDNFLQWILINDILPKQILFAKETGLQNWYLEQKRNPKGLRHICRVALQTYLHIGQRDVPRTKMSQLPLPPSIVDYVSLKLL